MQTRSNIFNEVDTKDLAQWGIQSKERSSILLTIQERVLFPFWQKTRRICAIHYFIPYSAFSGNWNFCNFTKICWNICTWGFYYSTPTITKFHFIILFSKKVLQTICFSVFRRSETSLQCGYRKGTPTSTVIDLLYLAWKFYKYMFCNLVADMLLHDLIRSMVNFSYIPIAMLAARNEILNFSQQICHSAATKLQEQLLPRLLDCQLSRILILVWSWQIKRCPSDVGHVMAYRCLNNWNYIQNIKKVIWSLCTFVFPINWRTFRCALNRRPVYKQLTLQIGL